MTTQFTTFADLVDIEARFLIVVGGLAPAAVHRHDLFGPETELRLKGLAAIGTFTLLGPPVNPMVVGCRLLAILAQAHVVETRFARKL